MAELLLKFRPKFFKIFRRHPEKNTQQMQGTGSETVQSKSSTSSPLVLGHADVGGISSSSGRGQGAGTESRPSDSGSPPHVASKPRQSSTAHNPTRNARRDSASAPLKADEQHVASSSATEVHCLAPRGSQGLSNHNNTTQREGSGRAGRRLFGKTLFNVSITRAGFRDISQQGAHAAASGTASRSTSPVGAAGNDEKGMVGAGVLFKKQVDAGGALIVCRCAEGTPAAAMFDEGVFSAGDELVAVEGVLVQGLSVRDVADKMKGPVGSSVVMTLLANSSNSRLPGVTLDQRGGAWTGGGKREDEEAKRKWRDTVVDDTAATPVPVPALSPPQKTGVVRALSSVICN